MVTIMKDITLLKQKNCKNVLFLCLLTILTVFCAGCDEKKSTQKREHSTPQATADTAEPLEDLVLEAKAITPNQVNLSWNKISRATGYDIFRKSYSIPRNKKNEQNDNEILLTHLTSNETSYQDTTTKNGYYYTYTVRAHRSLHLPDIAAHTTEDMPAILKITKTNVHTGVYFTRWVFDYHLNGSRDTPKACPDHITLPILVDYCNDDSTGIAMTGIEISRGTSLDNICKWEDVPITKDNLETIHKEPALLYQDKRVEAGETYYYQVRGYAEIGNKRFYGKRSNYAKISAVFPEGDFTMDLAEKKGKNPAFEISLQGNTAGSGRLEFIKNEWNGLVDYVYQKQDSTYHSVSMRLESCQKIGTTLPYNRTEPGDTQANSEKAQNWTPYDGQELYLDGQEQIHLRLVPLEGEKMAWPENGTTSAEIILRVKYDGEEAFLYFDAKEKRAYLRRIESETEPLHSIYRIIPKVNIYKYNTNRTRKAANLYSDDSVRFYGGLSFSYRGKTRNCPDGVEIYRSEDKKNFSFLDTVKYLDYGEEHHHVTYEDPSVQPGRTYYYKARNYVDTDTGKIYGEFIPPQVFLAQYYAGKYKIWLVDDKKNQNEKQFIIGIHSCSRGNPSLSFRFAGGYCQTNEKRKKYDGKGYFNLIAKAYSTDGIHWKKRKKHELKKSILPPKGTIYLKLALRKKQLQTKKYDRDRIARISVNCDVKDKDPWTLSWLSLTKELENGKLSYISLVTHESS